MIVLPQRQPLILAKQLTTVDVLSKGRLIFGIGVGYVEPELRALGVPMSERAARTDEYLAAIRAVWDEQSPGFSGRFVQWDSLVQSPRPVQRPGPPVVVGGATGCTGVSGALAGAGAAAAGSGAGVAAGADAVAVGLLVGTVLVVPGLVRAP